MKHKLIIGLEILLGAIIFTTGVTVFANQAGSSTDPLATKSYVDYEISKALESITTDNSGSVVINSSAYTPVYVSTGQVIYGREGTEIIMRSGKGIAVVNTAEGISDITLGKDLLNNEAIVKNHLLITPRDDRRGIKVTENAWFLVKGNYVIE